ncbi:MAG: glycosyltransferase [candidate division WOR-3 bacterium]|nr:glycosyltransferase [candidate division WOR-3 bacterium]
MRVSCVTSLYPSASRPSYGTFVKEFIWALAHQDVDCTVICPTSVFELRYGKLDPYETYDRVDDVRKIRVLRPRHITASAKQLLGFNTDVISRYTFEQAVAETLTDVSGNVDLLYGHFFYPSGKAVMKAGRALGKPTVVAHGDDCLAPWNLTSGVRDFKDISGVVAVSRRNKTFCEEVFKIPGERVRVFPNGVDLSNFRVLDKSEMRKELGLPTDQFLVVFVGHFIERKGPHRVLEAIEPLYGVSALMLGAGPIRLRSSKIVFSGPVAHSEMPRYLSAADAFVLPTTNEGCCNATLEAMACGIPIVSSRGEFNDEIIDDEVAIRVDPESIDQIRHAILTLQQDHSLRETMSRACLHRRHQFDIDTRARGVIEWFNEILARQTGSHADQRQSCA